MKSSIWLCTRNNPDEDARVYLEGFYEKSKANYLCGQLEQGKEGTLHLQFYLNFKNPVRITALTKLDQKGHYEKVKRDNGAGAYCMKEDTRVEGPWEFGIKPVQHNSKTDWEQVWQNAKEGKIEQIPADVRVQHYKNLKVIEKDYMKHNDSDHLRGIWIWGPAGIGKSRYARDKYPNAYPKLCNKWWDGYQGEQYVIMDDIGPEHRVLGQQLKIWSDRYSCILETKGGAVSSKYEQFVVTSQYSIEDIWDDQPTIDALKRRFTVIHMSDPFGIQKD